MLSKEQIIHALLSQEWVSGAEIADNLSISRSAVWSHIDDIKKKGYVIESDHKLGYKIHKTPNLLYPELVNYRLNINKIGSKIFHFISIGSTNDEAMKLGVQEAPDGSVIIAEQQTKGRGRYNRIWESSAGKGILCSILLRPKDIKPRDAYRFTILAAASITQSIIENLNLPVSIKWPNDIYISDKKVSGILTELSAESDRIKYVVIGFGINVNQLESDFPPNIPNAGSLSLFYGTPVDRLNLIKNILIKFDENYAKMESDNFEPIFDYWKNHCGSKGKTVAFTSGNISGSGIIVDINKDGGLVVKQGDNSEITLYSGDIRIQQ